MSFYKQFFYSSDSQATTNFLFVITGLPFLEWNHRVCTLLCLTAFIQHGAFPIHPCCVSAVGSFSLPGRTPVNGHTTVLTLLLRRVSGLFLAILV